MNIKRLLTNKKTSWVTGISLVILFYNFDFVYSSLIGYIGTYLIFAVFIGSIMAKLIGSVDESR